MDLPPQAASPFISDLPAGQPQEALETTLFRAPVFQRRLAAGEGVFLLIRSPQGGYSMREAGTYTRPILSSTSALFVGQGVFRGYLWRGCRGCVSV